MPSGFRTATIGGADAGRTERCTREKRVTDHPEPRRLLTRVVLRNYKSIAVCDVSPAQLSFLVGPNGAGKSNFLDAVRFVVDAVRFSLDHALRDRGGIDDVCRRSGGHPNHFGIRLDLELAGAAIHYAFIVGARKDGGYEVKREQCVVKGEAGSRCEYYDVQRGQVVGSTLTPSPPAAADRLYLVYAAGVEAFRPVYDALMGMGFYNLNPDAIRDLQVPDPGDLLKRDGGNAASVLARLGKRSPEAKKRIEEYLGAVTAGITGVDKRSYGHRETIEFRQRVSGAKDPWRFSANNMSDGTLRAFGVLVAVFQAADGDGAIPRLVGIEEPEGALHPAAASVVIDSLRDGAERAQVLVTSHSPDLLNDKQISDDSLLAVVARNGETRVGRVAEAARSTLRDQLCTAGELLRMNQLQPDPGIFDLKPEQLDLFVNVP